MGDWDLPGGSISASNYLCMPFFGKSTKLNTGGVWQAVICIRNGDLECKVILWKMRCLCYVRSTPVYDLFQGGPEIKGDWDQPIGSIPL